MKTGVIVMCLVVVIGAAETVEKKKDKMDSLTQNVTAGVPVYGSTQGDRGADSLKAEDSAVAALETDVELVSDTGSVSDSGESVEKKYISVSDIKDDSVRSDAAGSAMLFIKSEPSGAGVMIDGVEVEGHTPLFLKDLPEGKHTVEIRKETMVARENVQLVPDEITKVSVRLEKKKPNLIVNSEPMEADVYINKLPSKQMQPDGVTPFIVEFAANDTLNISLVKQGYRDTVITVIPEAGGRDVTVSLVEAAGGLAETRKSLRTPLTERGKKSLVCMGVSLVSGGVAGGLYYLAEKDFARAERLKKKLESGEVTDCDEWKYKVNENYEYTDNGNLKMSFVTGLSILSAISFGAMIYFYY